jgi:hypothetical protein
VQEQDEMSDICNDADFRQILHGLGPAQQREVAAIFVKHVLPLSGDTRLDRVIRTVADTDASEDELSAALKSARAATFDSHTRCGSEGHWSDQAGYFVARAAVAAATPRAQSRAGGPAWQAAMSARMAHTSMLIDDVSSHQSAHTECEWQYQSLADYLNADAVRN